MMIDKVREYIENEKLLRAGEKVVVGLSGGMDSMALIDLLTRLEYRCIAAHCNFHLRGEESLRDANFVKEWCKEAQIPLVTIDFDTHRHASHRKISIEMAARELRYDWFETIRREQSADSIAVAHHRDDSVETVLLNLIRGTGIRGVTGIVPRNQRVIRPLLNVSRDEIEAYVAERKIPYVVDSTNAEDAYIRNAIRLNIIPALETINPRAKEAIHRTSRHLSEVEKIYKQSIDQSIGSVFNNNRISIPLLRETPSPRAVLYELLFPLGFSPSTIEDVYQCMEGEPGKFFFSATHRLMKDRDFFLLDNTEKGPPDVASYTIHEGTDEIQHPIHLTLRTEEMPIEIRKERDFLYLDADKVVYPLQLRRWEQGDWFVPFGMKGRKKLSDFFTDSKLNRKEKEEVWVLLSGGQIVWIVGRRGDDRLRVTEATKRVLVIEQHS